MGKNRSFSIYFRKRLSNTQDDSNLIDRPRMSTLGENILRVPSYVEFSVYYSVGIYKVVTYIPYAHYIAKYFV